MPIHPDNRGRYAQSSWGVRVADFMSKDEVEAAAILAASGFNPMEQPLFWEVMVARMLSGVVTARTHQCDVELTVDGQARFAEVKFSNAFGCDFSIGRRAVFKWALPRGHGGKHLADVIILIGWHEEKAFSWVMPRAAVDQSCKSITVTVPSVRAGSWGKWDAYAVPFDQLLPEFLRALDCRAPVVAMSTKGQRAKIMAVAARMAFELECSTGRRIAR